MIRAAQRCLEEGSRERALQQREQKETRRVVLFDLKFLLTTFLGERIVTTWEYKCVGLDRTGKQQDQFGLAGSSWTYTPWVMSGTGQQMSDGLDQLGRDGWELVGVLPSEFWAEGTMMRNSSHGVRAIACTLLLKKPQSFPQAAQVQPEAAQLAGPSVADELTKLLELEKAGALTRWEFNAQKAKLLGT